MLETRLGQTLNDSKRYVPVDRWRPLDSEDWNAVLTSPVDCEDLILTCLHGTWWDGEGACRWKVGRAEQEVQTRLQKTRLNTRVMSARQSV